MAARASRVENQDAIDAAIVGMLGDPKEVYSFMMIYIHVHACKCSPETCCFNLIVVIVLCVARITINIIIFL